MAPWHRGSWYQESAVLTALRDQAEADEVELNSLRHQMLVTPVLYIFDEMEGFSIEQVLAAFAGDETPTTLVLIEASLAPALARALARSQSGWGLRPQGCWQRARGR